MYARSPVKRQYMDPRTVELTVFGFTEHAGSSAT